MEYKLKLIWTKIPPTKPGYYWLKSLETVPLVTEYKQNDLRYIRDPLPNSTMRWAGPIFIPIDVEHKL